MSKPLATKVSTLLSENVQLAIFTPQCHVTCWCYKVSGVLNLVLSLSLSHTGHWKFNMAPHDKEWPPNNPHPLHWLYDSLSCSWCLVSALAPLSCGSRRIIQVDAADWWWLRRDPPPPHMIVKCFGCTTIHNKALYKLINSFIHSALWGSEKNNCCST